MFKNIMACCKKCKCRRETCSGVDLQDLLVQQQNMIIDNRQARTKKQLESSGRLSAPCPACMRTKVFGKRQLEVGMCAVCEGVKPTSLGTATVDVDVRVNTLAGEKYKTEAAGGPSEIVVGCVVRLKSGGPKMTVAGLREDADKETRAWLMYFGSECELKEIDAPVESLVLVS